MTVGRLNQIYKVVGIKPKPWAKMLCRAEEKCMCHKNTVVGLNFLIMVFLSSKTESVRPLGSFVGQRHIIHSNCYFSAGMLLCLLQAWWKIWIIPTLCVWSESLRLILSGLSWSSMNTERCVFLCLNVYIWMADLPLMCKTCK